MFTGLVEATGTIAHISQAPEGGKRFHITVPSVLNDLATGDSLAIDGACMTVTERVQDGEQTRIAFDASPESLSKTTLQFYTGGSVINLERPLTPASRVGGHFVTGHVDDLARLVFKAQDGNSWILKFMLPNAELVPYLLPKGSVAINGISLTVNAIQGNIFSVAIIPHTMEVTNLSNAEEGDQVNLETDMLGKYVHRLLASGAVQNLGQNHSAGKAPNKPGAGSSIHEGEWFNMDPAITGIVGS